MRKSAFFAGLLCLALASGAQDAKTFQSEFRLAQKAAGENDAAAYLAHMQEAMKLEHDRPGRPFYQYNLARAQAMNGKGADAVATLTAMWNERIEGPMIAFAGVDPAFENLRKTPEYAAVPKLFDGLAIDLSHAGGSVFEIQGVGCTLAASIGADGVLLVDSGYPGTAAPLKRSLTKQAGKEPRVRYVVNTHGHFDHAASNHDVGPDAVVIAHPSAVEELKSGSDFVPGFRIPAVETEDLPDVLTDRRLTIPFNGENVHVIAAPAHTAGDLVVWFEGSKVLHMGDDYFGAETATLFPGADPAAFYSTLGELLATVPDDAVVISGHAARVPASKLKTAVAASRAVFDFVREAVAAGKSNEAILEEGLAKGHPRRRIEFHLRNLPRPAK